jgi:hypothetical protein
LSITGNTIAIYARVILANDRITNDSVVKVSLTLGNNLVLASDEMLQVSANGTDEPFTVLPNKVPDNLTCMTYLALLFSPEVQSLSFANVQLPALSIATITGKITNLSNASGLSISEIKFFSTNSVMHTVSSENSRGITCIACNISNGSSNGSCIVT